MSVFDKVVAIDHPTAQANKEELDALRHRLIGESPNSILEVCQNWSHLSLGLAAVLADQGSGSLTTFRDSSGSKPDLIKDHAIELGLEERISPIQPGRSYTWAMQRLLGSGNQHSFDICVLNGNKSWEASGFQAVLADIMLRPGGLMVLSGITWSMDKSPYFQSRKQVTQKYSADELSARPVQLVMDMILPHLGYDVLDTPEIKSFGIARKL